MYIYNKNKQRELDVGENICQCYVKSCYYIIPNKNMVRKMCKSLKNILLKHLFSYYNASEQHRYITSELHMCLIFAKICDIM